MVVRIDDTEYEISKKVDTILEALDYIKTHKNNYLAYRYHCKSGVCGSCAIKVNGVEKLSCITKIEPNVVLEPLNYHNKIKDLTVKSNSDILQKITPLNKQHIEPENICILCESCYSSCPVFAVNKDFVGPFGLVRAYLYDNDSNIVNLQQNGIWDCTLCGNCNLVCPAKIDIKGDIQKLQSKSAKQGLFNPNFNSFGLTF